jgi:hypothetical protein
MKKMRSFLTGIFTVLCGATVTKAQDVYLSVPDSNIFNRSEFTSVPTRVMTNANRTNWDYAFWDYSQQLLHLLLFPGQILLTLLPHLLYPVPLFCGSWKVWAGSCHLPDFQVIYQVFSLSVQAL